MTESQTRYGYGLTILLGLFTFACVLAFHNITEGDLWGKLATGASVWERGHVLWHDPFAFTPTLPTYIEHEWGAGTIFYGLIKFLGPWALMLLKMTLAFGALGFAMLAGRRQGCETGTLLLLAVPAAACILPGYIPVLRSHAFTFCFFGLTLFCLETLRAGGRWAAFALPLAMLFWCNTHGGFVIGLGVVCFYAAGAIATRTNAAWFAGAALACLLVTLINPYGFGLWQYLIPALLNPRARIEEWRPLPLWAADDFQGFRLLFILTLAVIALGWKRVRRKNWFGLLVLAGTAVMGWRSRRNGPFLGVAALAFAGPYLEALVAGVRSRINLVWVAGGLYAAMAFYAAIFVLPRTSLQPLAPIGEDPVREADILSRASVKGNVACPFAWGCYLSWRLYPNIKVSMDGRYEAAYPESSFLMNAAFFDHGTDWLKLLHSAHVDFVILDMIHDPLRPEDLEAQGYSLVWKTGNISALLCLPEHAAALVDAARNLPETTIDPLDLKSRPQPLFGRE